ncbi:hypothetical protein CTA1_9181 [Colletotrichum tanaceti]|uniref:Uncharacterized protein n=1 Tax=Colletotrichum tanaceti TaxID=1306861 RepID=A0A4U6XQ30_9PEZI|nr:hypothetical protein CTA1_9181 [Colletotrichum tanaceti]
MPAESRARKATRIWRRSRSRSRSRSCSCSCTPQGRPPKPYHAPLALILGGCGSSPDLSS